MKKILAICIALATPIASAEINLNAQGSVAKAPIEMSITITENGEAKGHYFYLKTKVPIELSGSLAGETLTLRTINNPDIDETFVGDVIITTVDWPEATNIAEFKGTWYGKHTLQGETPKGYPFEVTDPLADGKVTCDEIVQYPNQIIDRLDLGSGRGSPIKVDYECPKSLASIDFLKNMMELADQIRSPVYGSTCNGSIVYAHWRYYQFNLAWLGYYPDGYGIYSEVNPAQSYFQYWSYNSLYNHDLYEKYMAVYEEVKPMLKHWYEENHGGDDKQAEAYTRQALGSISTWAYGHGGYQSPEWDVVPYTDEAIKGDANAFADALPKATELQKLNSLKRLIVHEASPETISLLANSIENKTLNHSQESPISLAVKNPKIIPLLIEAGFEADHANDFGKTPLFYAIQYNQRESVKSLLEYNVDINKQYQSGDDVYNCFEIKKWGRTPLMHAAQHADVSMLKLLIENGSDFKVQDDSGKTALDYAVEMENVHYLESIMN